MVIVLLENVWIGGEKVVMPTLETRILTVELLVERRISLPELDTVKPEVNVLSPVNVFDAERIATPLKCDPSPPKYEAVMLEPPVI